MVYLDGIISSKSFFLMGETGSLTSPSNYSRGTAINSISLSLTVIVPADDMLGPTLVMNRPSDSFAPSGQVPLSKEIRAPLIPFAMKVIE